MNVMDQFSQCVADATVDCMDRVQSGEITNLGQLGDEIAATTTSLINKLAPQAGAEVAALIEPATQKAIEAIRPMLKELLTEQAPIVAGIVGLFTAAAIILGVAVAKERSAKRRGGR